MLVTFDKDIQPHINYLSHLEISGKILKDVIIEVFNLFPSLYVAFSESNNLDYNYIFILNDSELLEITDLNREVTSSDELTILTVPCGKDALSIGNAIIDFAADIGAISAGTWAAAGNISAMIVGNIVLTGAMLALSMVIGALSGDLEMPSIYSGSLDNSATYTFTGIKNTTASGTPVQIVYGQHRTGGQVLALFTESQDTNTEIAQTATSVSTDTFLFYQLGISEGEITGISDIEVNKLPSSFYSSVFTAPDANYIRYGTSSQDTMPEFDKIFNTTTIARKIINIPNVNLASGDVTYSEYQPVKGIVYYDGASQPLKLGNYKSEVQYIPE